MLAGNKDNHEITDEFDIEIFALKVLISNIDVFVEKLSWCFIYFEQFS